MSTDYVTKSHFDKRLQEIIAPLATRKELQDGLKAVAEEMRGHFNAVAERIETKFDTLVEGYNHVQQKQDALETSVNERFKAQTKRIDGLEDEIGRVMLHTGMVEPREQERRP